MKDKSIAFKLSFFVLTFTGLIFAGIFGYNYFVSRQMILKNIEENARNLSVATAQRIETVLRSVQEVPETVAEVLQEISYDKAVLNRLLSTAVENNPAIYGSTAAFEPGSFEKGAQFFAPYFYKSGGGIQFTHLGGNDYRYFFFDWYQIPKELGRPSWTEPYYDEGGGNVIMSTYSAPFYRREGGERKFAGVVTADVSLGWLQKMVSEIRIAKTGYAFLISRNGTFVTHPHKSLIMNETLFSTAEVRGDRHLREVGRDMIRGHSGFVPFTSLVSGQACWMGYAPVPSTGWSVGVIFPKDELLADVQRLGRIDLALAFCGFLILFSVIVLISGSITRPLRALADAAKALAKGNWEIELPPARSKDEVGTLSASFLYMKEALKKYIRELTETTAAKERMEGELKVAHEIQMSLVPKVFPPFPKRPELDIYAVLEPAREVGGDLYDFFFIDENRLCFVIGDVSGKGVPAALFMAMTKTLIKTNAKMCTSPEEILEKVNVEISEGNDACMFVTVFCGILDTRTGEVCYSNGGHNPPFILRKGQAPEFLRGGHSPAVGVLEDAVFEKAGLKMEPGDALYLYTDGVTEACDDQDELFSEERLQEMLSGPVPGSLKGLVEKTLQEVRSFSGAMPQADDITLLVLRYYGARGEEKEGGKMKLMLENKLTELSKLQGALAEFSGKVGLSQEVLHDLQLVLEEIVVNVISYAYADTARHEIVVSLEKEGSELAVRVQDEGRAFDPLKVPEPDLDVPVEERPIGGLGMHLVRNLAREVNYERVQGKNILTLKISLPTAS